MCIYIYICIYGCTSLQCWLQHNFFDLYNPWPGVVLQLRLKTRFGPGLSLPAVSTSPKDLVHRISFLLGSTRRPRNAKKYEKKDAAGEGPPGRSQAPKAKASASGKRRSQPPGADSNVDPGAGNAAPKKKAKKTKKWSVFPRQVCGIYGKHVGNLWHGKQDRPCMQLWSFNRRFTSLLSPGRGNLPPLNCSLHASILVLKIYIYMQVQFQSCCFPHSCWEMASRHVEHVGRVAMGNCHGG